MEPSYVYRCEILRTIDGDTLAVKIDLGFGVYKECNLRLLGINCPERNTPEGKRAKDFTAAWAARNPKCVIHSAKAQLPPGADKYGDRWDALVVGDTVLNDDLVTLGYAVRVNFAQEDAVHAAWVEQALTKARGANSGAGVVSDPDVGEGRQ